jgi:hypothetical protein
MPVAAMLNGPVTDRLAAANGPAGLKPQGLCGVESSTADVATRHGNFWAMPSVPGMGVASSSLGSYLEVGRFNAP